MSDDIPVGEIGWSNSVVEFDMSDVGRLFDVEKLYAQTEKEMLKGLALTKDMMQGNDPPSVVYYHAMFDPSPLVTMEAEKDEFIRALEAGELDDDD